MEATSDFILFLGRFHPMILHLPIGIMVLGALLELGLSRGWLGADFRKQVSMIWLGAFLSAMLSALLGWLLSFDSAYVTEQLNTHQWLGFGTVFLSLILYLASRPDKSGLWKKAYRPTLILSLIFLALTGHYGANLTHGSGYLFQYAANPIRSLAGLPPKDKIVSPANPEALQAARASGIQIYQIVENSPWLSASLAYQDSISADQWEKLNDFSDQLTELNLKGTGLQDRELAQIQNLNRLQKLHLEETAVSDDGLSYLKDLTDLQYLNLFGTAVSDAGLKNLYLLKKLKKLFVWQSEVTAAGLEALQNEIPGLETNMGTNTEALFGVSKLPEPEILIERDLFTDSQEVAFHVPFQDIAIHYTLDGQDPDSTAPRFETPFVLHQSTQIKAFALKKGWLASDIVSRDLIKVGSPPEAIQLDHRPHPNYKGNGPQTLVDLKRGTDQFKEPFWLGFEGQDLIGTLDMGKIKALSAVHISCLENTGAWIFYPKQMKVSLSRDGKQFQQVALRNFPVADGPTSPSRKMFTASFDAQEARYVRLHTRNVTKVPAWHPGAGGKAWLFMDEILIE